MRRLYGLPPGLMRLGECTYRYRGHVDFQIQRGGFLFSWWCHDGFQAPPSLAWRKMNRQWGLPAGDRGITSMMREDGWGSTSKNALLRKICRSIDKELARLDQEDRRYLEAKGVRMGHL